MTITKAFMALSEVCEAQQRPLRVVLAGIESAGIEPTIVHGRVSLTAEQEQALREHLASKEAKRNGN